MSVMNISAIYERHPVTKEITTFAIPSGFAGATLALSSGTLDNDLFTIRDGKLWWISAPDYESPADSDTNNIYEIEVTFTKTDGTNTQQRYNLEVMDIGPQRHGYDLTDYPDGKLETYFFLRSFIPLPEEPGGLANTLPLGEAYAMSADGGPLVLTWGIDPSSFLSAEDVRPILNRALTMFEEAANIKFIEVDDGKVNVDLRLFFGDSGTSPEGPHVLGTASSANTKFYFSDSSALNQNFNVVLHELGHSLGLNHPFVTTETRGWIGKNEYRHTPDSIMSYYNHPNGADARLQEADIAALQFLYGAPGEDHFVSPQEYMLSSLLARYVPVDNEFIQISETAEIGDAIFTITPKDSIRIYVQQGDKYAWVSAPVVSPIYRLYSNRGDNHLFSIDRNTGVITLKQKLDFDMPLDTSDSGVFVGNNVYEIGISVSTVYIEEDGTEMPIGYANTILVELVEKIDLANGDSDIDVAARGASRTPTDYRGKEVFGSNGNNRIHDGHGNDIIHGRGGDDMIILNATHKDQNQIIYRIGNQLAIDGGDTIIDFMRGADRLVLALDDTTATRAITDNANLIQYLKGDMADNQSDDQFLVKLDMVIDPETGAVLVEGLSLHFKDSVLYDGGRKSVPVMTLKFSEASELREIIGGDETSRAKIIDDNGFLLDLNLLEHLLGGADSLGFIVETDTRTPNKVNAPAANRITIDATMADKVLSDAGGDDTYLIQADAADGVVINDAAGKSTIIFADGVRVLSVAIREETRLRYGEITFDHGATTETRVLRVDQLDQARFQFETNTLPTQDLSIEKFKTFIEGAPLLADAYAAQLAIDAARGSTVITLSAVNMDSGRTLSYAFTRDSNANNLFAIDGATGAITLARESDSDVATTHILKVQVTNGASTAITTVTVQLGDAPQPPEPPDGTTITTPPTSDAPSFDQSSYVAIVAEDADSGIEVGYVSATAADANDQLTYAFTSDGNPGDLFAIDSESGVITLAGTLDYETAKTHRLTVSASDGTNMATTTVTILVTDYIGDAPVFSQAVSDFSVSEDTSIDSGVASVFARGDAKDLTYSIIEGNSDNLFALIGFSELAIQGIIHNGAAITLNRALDYETTPRHVLTIQASDGTNTATTVVRITVLDVNEYAPMFDASSYTAEVAENTASGSVITVVKATDADGWALRNYAITGGDPDNLFAIDANTGAITRTSSSSLTADDIHRLTIEVSDDKHTASTAELVVTVTASANLPKFKKPLHSIRLDEDTSVGATVTSVEATSMNSATPLTYKIIDGNDAGHFTIIDAASGEITLANALDYETTDSSRASRSDVRYVLTIEASDGVNTAITLVKVTVGDANEAPVFDQQSYAMELAEDAVSGTKVIGVSATDEDHGDIEINYAITGGNSDNLFTIDTATGIITLIGTLDIESTTTHILTVEASSGNRDAPRRSKSATTTVTVKVLDATNLAPVFDVALYTPTIAENAATGSFVTWVHASDADANDTLTYSIISGNSNKLFAIEDHNGTSGRITLKGTLDYETATSHTITVEARDSAGAIATAKVTINVADANDNAPIFNKKTQDVMVLEVAAIGTTIATVTARDADTEAGNLRYSILGDRNASPFAINATTGVITLVGELDYEIASTHTLVVQASDGIHTDTSKVVVDVIESQTASLGITTSTDVIDAGTTLTASITHDDPQGYEGGTAPASGWVWFYKSNPETDIGDGSATYTVQAGDAGEQIGVRLTYTDGEGHGDTAETHLTEAVQRVIIKSYAQDDGKDKTYTAETDKATHIEAGGGADHVRDGNRNDVINGGKGDDEIDLSASKEDNDVVVYGIGNQMASDGSDSITSFVRGRDKFVFQLKQSDIDAGNIDLSADDGYEGFINYVTKGTEDLIDDQFWVNFNFSIGENGVQMDGISFHFKDSTFFSGGRISMPIVSIEFADPLSVDEVREVYSGRDKSTPLVKQGLLSDFDYLDDFLGGDGAIGFEII